MPSGIPPPPHHSIAPSGAAFRPRKSHMRNRGQHIPHPKLRGEWAELRFQLRAAELGLILAKPCGDCSPYDFIVACPGTVNSHRRACPERAIAGERACPDRAITGKGA